MASEQLLKDVSVGGVQLKENVLKIFHQDHRPNQRLMDGQRIIYWDNLEYEHNNYPQLRTELSRNTEMRRMCLRMFSDIQNTCAARHFTKLDDYFTSLLECAWCYKVVGDKLISDPLHDDKINAVVETTLSFLERLPSYTTQLPFDLNSLPEAFFKTENKNWSSLHVTAAHTSNTVRLILYRVLTMEQNRGSWDNGNVHRLINCVGELIGITAIEANNTSVVIEKQYWFLVRVFLWNFWQSSRMFFAFCTLKIDVDTGARHATYSHWSRNFLVAEFLSLQELTDNSIMQHKPHNMCSWALEILKTDPICLGWKFQAFYQSYRSITGHIPIRCTRDADRVCDGRHAENCLRYKGLIVEDQSMHDVQCKWNSGCSTKEPKLKWNESLYRDIRGPRAVSIDNDESESLSFCRANSNTLAISHVWSHGQGGRPETGINLCLHKRYVGLAEQLGCTSYWMDTVSIPTDHDLRRDAIANINEVFFTSKVVLVCDRDLMSIDIGDASPERCQAILCAILMCDWNTRAWTVLEGLKGRQAIHFLLSGNHVVRFVDILRCVVSDGEIEVAIFGSYLSHIIPWYWHGKDTVEEDMPPDKQAMYAAAEKAGSFWLKHRTSKVSAHTSKLDIEVAGSWLSHRPASRAGDDLVIWSLLPSDTSKPVFEVEKFWRTQGTVRTGFLLSSAERLTRRGLSWAPRSSYAVPPRRSDGTFPTYHRPLASPESSLGAIMPYGLVGEWQIYQFGSLSSSHSIQAKPASLIEVEIDRIRKRFIRIGRRGGLFYPVREKTYQLGESLSYGRSGTSLLFAVCDTNRLTFREFRDRNYWEKRPPGLENAAGPIIERHDPREVQKRSPRGKGIGSYRWEWRGVYAWPQHVPPPTFELHPYVWIS